MALVDVNGQPVKTQTPATDEAIQQIQGLVEKFAMTINEAGSQKIAMESVLQALSIVFVRCALARGVTAKVMVTNLLDMYQRHLEAVEKAQQNGTGNTK